MDNSAKKIKPISIVCFILAAVLGAVAVFFIFFGGVSAKEESKEAVNVFEAEEEDVPVYLNMQYMTESVAYLEAVESMQYYITFDSELTPAVICMYDSELETYQPYMDWLYTEEEEGGPEEIRVTGYSVPFDDELRQFVADSFNYIFGVEYVTEDNFEEFFGEYYLSTGKSSGSFENFNIGIYCLLGLVILVIIGVAISYKSLIGASEAEAGNYLEVHKTYRARGVLGALLGALLGGVLWATVGALGMIIGWLGILIVLFAITGYRIFAKEESVFGTVVSVIFSLLVIFPATYFAEVWMFYQELNKNVYEYISLGRAFVSFSDYLTNTDSWGLLIQDMVLGFVCMAVAGIYCLVGISKNKQKKEENIAEFASTVDNVAEEEQQNDQ